MEKVANKHNLSGASIKGGYRLVYSSPNEDWVLKIAKNLDGAMLLGREVEISKGKHGLGARNYFTRIYDWDGKEEERKAQQDAQAQIAAYDKAQAIQDTYRSRYASDLALAQGMGNLPGSYSQAGMGIGANLTGIAGTAAGMQSSAAKQMSDATAGMGGGMAGAVNRYINPSKD